MPLEQFIVAHSAAVAIQPTLVTHASLTSGTASHTTTTALSPRADDDYHSNNQQSPSLTNSGDPPAASGAEDIMVQDILRVWHDNMLNVDECIKVKVSTVIDNINSSK